MSTILNSTVQEVLVDPMSGWSNPPSLKIILSEEPEVDQVYQYIDGLYWTQDESGLTSFLYLKSNTEYIGVKDGLPHYQTCVRDEGFGGRIFTLKVKKDGMCYVSVRGPWSSGCYHANNYLPKPATEVVYYCPQYGCGIAGYLTVEKANELLQEFMPNWQVILVEEYGKKLFPELAFKGERKEKWSAETKQMMTKVTVDVSNTIRELRNI